MLRLGSLGFVLLLATTLSAPARAAKRPPPAVGRWNLAMTTPDGSTFPSWLELTFDTKTGALDGRFTGRVGRTRPLDKVEWTKQNELVFAVNDPLTSTPRTYRAKIRFGMLEGTAEATGEPTFTLLGARPPKFLSRRRVAWGKPVALISRGLIGWRLRDAQHGTCWKENAGVLESKPTCVNIVSDGRYQDFKLHVELKLAPGGATGIYLRGRYEVQMVDDAGKPPTDESSGAIYGLLAPSKNAAKKADEWQTLDVTLVGRRVTVVLNDQVVIDDQEIDGPTGGALDSDEQIPGSVMLEAERGALSFRNLVVTPALW